MVMEKKLSHISPDEYAALMERVSGLELALSALASDNEALAADNASLAQELERERASRDEEVARAVEAAVAAVRAELQAVIDSRGAENARLVEQFKMLQQSFFGSRSERVDPGQLSLFNDAEAAADGSPEPVAEAPKRKRRRGGPRRVDLSRLETVVVEHGLAGGGLACPRCGCGMAEVGVEVTRKLRMVPAHLVVEEHRVHKYACPECCGANAAGEEVGSVIVRAPRPPEAFPKSLATPSLVAWVIEQKYAMSLPLYRLESAMARLGCEVSRADMCNWVMLAWERWLVHVRDRIRAYILSRPVAHADDYGNPRVRETPATAQQLRAA
jgi:transposase